VQDKVFFFVQPNDFFARLMGKEQNQKSMQMKKLLLLFAVLALLLPQDIAAQKRHRATQTTTNDTLVLDNNDNAVEAFSDTASVSEDTFDLAEDTNTAVVNVPMSINPGDYDDPFTFFNALWGVGIGGVLIALFIVLLVLLVLALPLILLIFLLRYLWKSSDYKAERRIMELERERMNMYNGDYQGGTEPQQTAKTSHNNSQGRSFFGSIVDEYMFHKGVRNVSIGLGLAIMFGFWGAEALVGVGCLVICLGLGQVFIAWASGKKKTQNEVIDADNIDSFADDEPQKA